MSDLTKPDKTRQPKKTTGAKNLRAKTIIAKALAGEKTADIAKDLGVSRQTVSAALNSDEVKKKVSEIDQVLAKGIDDAIRTVLNAVKYDYDAAYDLLKNFGSMKSAVDLHHQFPKPVVIKRANGEEIILGTDEGKE